MDFNLLADAEARSPALSLSDSGTPQHEHSCKGQDHSGECKAQDARKTLTHPCGWIWVASGCSAPRGTVSCCTGNQHNAIAAWLSQQAGGRHKGAYYNGSYWEGENTIPVVGSSGPGYRKSLLTRAQPMAGWSQTSRVTAQSRFYCICLNRILRAGELSPQHRKYNTRHRTLHLILNCLFFFYLCLNFFWFKLSMIKVNLRLNFPGSGKDEREALSCFCFNCESLLTCALVHCSAALPQRCL